MTKPPTTLPFYWGKRSLWVWYSDAPHGGYLFRGNPNPGYPPYSMGDIDDLINGRRLVCAETRRALEMEVGVHEWNIRFPKHKVKPVSIMVEIRPYYKRKQKEAK